MKLRLTIATMGLLFLLAAIQFATVDFEASDLGQAVLERLEEAVDVQLEASRFRWSFTKGLVVEDVEASSGFPGGRFVVKASQISFENEWLPLLAKKVVIRRFTIKQPRIRMTKISDVPQTTTRKNKERESGPSDVSPSKSPSHVDLYLFVSEFAIEDGVFTTGGVPPGSGGMTFEGVDLVFRDLRFQPGSLTLLHGLVSQAELNARIVDLGSVQLRNVRGPIAFAKGRIVLPELAYSTSDGVFQARFSADFNQIPFGYELSLEGDPFEVGPRVGSENNLPGTLIFDAKGFGTDIVHTSGRGVLQLREGVLASFPIVIEAEKTLGGGRLVGASFESVEVPFEVKGGQVVLQPFELRTQSATLIIEGSVSIDGALSVNITVGSLDGRDSTHLRVSGSLDEPIVEVARGQ